MTTALDAVYGHRMTAPENPEASETPDMTGWSVTDLGYAVDQAEVARRDVRNAERHCRERVSECHERLRLAEAAQDELRRRYQVTAKGNAGPWLGEAPPVTVWGSDHVDRSVDLETTTVLETVLEVNTDTSSLSFLGSEPGQGVTIVIGVQEGAHPLRTVLGLLCDVYGESAVTEGLSIVTAF